MYIFNIANLRVGLMNFNRINKNKRKLILEWIDNTILVLLKNQAITRITYSLIDQDNHDCTWGYHVTMSNNGNSYSPIALPYVLIQFMIRSAHKRKIRKMKTATRLRMYRLAIRKDILSAYYAYLDRIFLAMRGSPIAKATHRVRQLEKLITLSGLDVYQFESTE